MAEENKILTESLIPGEKEQVAVLAYGINHYMYFVDKICDAANNNVHNRFTYIERPDQLRAAHKRYSKIIALPDWTIRKPGHVIDEIQEYITHYGFKVIEVDDKEL